MAMPVDVTEVGLILYKQLAPLAEQDEKWGWALLRYVDALMSQSQTVRDQVRDRGDTAPFEVLMDPDECPEYALDYLSMFAGVDLDALRTAYKLLKTNEVINPNFDHDAKASAEPYGWEALAEAATSVSIATTEVWSASGSQSLLFKATKDNTATTRLMGPSIKHSALYQIGIKENEWLAVQAVLNILQAPALGFTISVKWYEGSKVISTATHTGLAKGLTGVQTVNAADFKAPAKATWARISIQGETKTALQVVEFYTDNVTAVKSAAESALPLSYIDGDTFNCLWLGEPGKSHSAEVEPIGAEELVTQKREAIKKNPYALRGKVSSIVEAVQPYLTGDKVVFVQERPGGSAWRVRVATFLGETINSAVVRHAIELVLPAGIILEYEAVPAVNYFLISVEFATYKVVGEEFLTYAGLRTDTPGT